MAWCLVKNHRYNFTFTFYLLPVKALNRNRIPYKVRYEKYVYSSALYMGSILVVHVTLDSVKNGMKPSVTVK